MEILSVFGGLAMTDKSAILAGREAGEEVSEFIREEESKKELPCALPPSCFYSVVPRSPVLRLAKGVWDQSSLRPRTERSCSST